MANWQMVKAGEIKEDRWRTISPKIHRVQSEAPTELACGLALTCYESRKLNTRPARKSPSSTAGFVGGVYALRSTVVRTTPCADTWR
jgi:hypothetical protein